MVDDADAFDSRLFYFPSFSFYSGGLVEHKAMGCLADEKSQMKMKIDADEAMGTTALNV